MAPHLRLTRFTPTLLIGRRSMLLGFTLGALNFRAICRFPRTDEYSAQDWVPGFTEMLHDLSALISCAVCHANLKPF